MNNSPCYACGGKQIVNRSVSEDGPPDEAVCPVCMPVDPNSKYTIQQKFDMLSGAVEKMRDAQNNYFTTRHKSDLQTAKELEKVVDRLLSSYKVPGYQQSLF